MISKKVRAFTLVELLVVVIILAVLAAIVAFVIPAAVRRAKESALRTTLAELQSAVDRFYAECNTYPIGSDIVLDGETWAAQIDFEKSDGKGKTFVPDYIRFMPDTNPVNYGLDPDDGNTLYFGLTVEEGNKGLVFATQEPPEETTQDD